ncbi:ATP-dependent DNA helicase [Salipaludibacillus sp. CUR1]|uniref:RecQ family ATP-dependent DNA helicase n=1 Tax=Salipaludibacillus sp. CUR1 TaxID=2820003 RepID=UPI001E39E314|nr:ATP-dependent DNA helicase RecQ [Salipaludibacillus sp. CUR1]MCE7791050.1 ATP-dependent DNA helicase [Salipaludibacillus sp. CUR1]
MTLLDDTLNKEFGYPAFRKGQKEIIQSVLEQRDVIAILPTGGGKSLCYHLPAIVLGGLTLVISPLVSLMEDQVTQMKAAGHKKVAHLSSLLSREEKTHLLENLEEYQIVFVSPEMIALPFIRERFKNQDIKLFVIDEAHCISQWGHEFRTDYLRLSEVRRDLGNPPCLALTATATPEVEKDIRLRLEMKNEAVYRLPVNRSNIFIASDIQKNTAQKNKRFFEVINRIEKPAIVYTGTRNSAVNYSLQLQKHGFPNTAFYHGGIPKEERILVQQQFLRDELDIICCTNAFGMGINKSNVRSVVHLHIPSSVEQYVQEIGRAGRDEKQSMALLLCSEEDRFLPLSLIESEFPQDWWITNFLMDDLSGKKVEEMERIYQPDEKQWKMLLYYLENQQIISEGSFTMLQNPEKVIQEIKNHFEKRKKEKFIQLEKMNQMIASRSCLRKGISNYFKEETEESPDCCCSNCQSFESFIEKVKKQSAPEKETVQKHWKIELEDMLLRDAGGEKCE